MKIVIVGSISASEKIIEISNKLEKMGYKTEIPYTTKKIQNGEMTLAEYNRLKKVNDGDYIYRQQATKDLIKDYFHHIHKSDAILVLNLTKNGIKNYIGGNALMELGFAYVLDKPIFLYNPVPKMSYTDEILSVKPIVLNRNLQKLQKILAR